MRGGLDDPIHDSGHGSSRSRWNNGDPDALKQLLDVVYPELKRAGRQPPAPRARRSHAAADGARARGVHPPLGLCEGCGSRAGGTSTARRRWRCGASWSTTRASGRRASAAARISNGRRSRKHSTPRSICASISSGSTRRSRSWQLFAPEKARIGGAALLRRAVDRGDGGAARHRAGDGQAALDVRARVAAPRPERMSEPAARPARASPRRNSPTSTPSSPRRRTLTPRRAAPLLDARCAGRPQLPGRDRGAPRSHDRRRRLPDGAGSP